MGKASVRIIAISRVLGPLKRILGFAIRALSNTFTVRLERTSQQLVRQAVVSGSEADRFAAKHARHFTSPTLRYEGQRGGKGYYDMLRATLSQPLSAPRFNRLMLPEKKQLLPHASDFLVAVRTFKDDYRAVWRAAGNSVTSSKYGPTMPVRPSVFYVVLM